MPSATPEPGQSVLATLSTVDDSATGIKSIIYYLQYLHIALLLFIGGLDYVPLASITLTFTSTSLQRQCVNVGIIDDSEVEPLEQFFVQLDQTTSQGPISSQAEVLIVNGTI